MLDPLSDETVLENPLPTAEPPCAAAPMARPPALPAAFARGPIPRRRAGAAPQQRVSWYRHAPALARRTSCG